MTQEEYRAAKGLKEPETPQAPEMGAAPETPPAQNDLPPDEGDREPTPPPKTPEQRAQEEAAEYRRKYQESEGKVGLLQQQINFAQTQLQTLQQQNQARQPQQQEEQVPEFEDPNDAIKWIDQKYAKKFEQEKAALKEDFKQSQLKTKMDKVAGKVMDAYPDIFQAGTPLSNAFVQECIQLGVNPQKPDPFTLEAASAIAAAKCGILPKTFQQNTTQPLQTVRPPLPGIQRPAGPKPAVSLPQLSQRQLNWSKGLGLPPDKVQEFMKKNEGKYIRADGTPLYPSKGRSN